MNRLFVYGIFLGEELRKEYGMTNPEYATVQDYLTFGHRIVKAEHLAGLNLALTGLKVDIDPHFWPALDDLEGGYKRSIVTTTDGETLYMYTA